jgi:hypothetical protein
MKFSLTGYLRTVNVLKQENDFKAEPLRFVADIGIQAAGTAGHLQHATRHPVPPQSALLFYIAGDDPA